MGYDLPYLEAIQSIPGDVPSDKFKWISKLVTNRIRARGESLEMVELKEVPTMLIPFVKVEAAKTLKQYDVIVEALKSEDMFIVNKALQAAWFFDGRNKNVINVNYFLSEVFPYVSLYARTRIIKSLAHHLTRKETGLAEEFFCAVNKLYGIDQAMPLLSACSDSFIYDTAVNLNIWVPPRILKILFPRSPDVVIRCLKLTGSKKQDECGVRKSHISMYKHIVMKLIKRHLEDFVELIEMHRYRITDHNMLSNTRAAYFLKNGKEHLLRNPRLFLDIIPLKMIDAKFMEVLLPKLMPERSSNYQTIAMLEYLVHYSKEEKYYLLTKTYKEMYGKDLVDNHVNVIPALLKIMPTEERVRQARIKMEITKAPYESKCNMETAWRCYLPADEAITLIREEISKTGDMIDRADLLKHMIYTCKVNKDDNALLQMLKYFNQRHRNERSALIEAVMEELVMEYDLSKLSEEHWTILYEITRRSYVKRDIRLGSHTMLQLLEAAVHYKLLHAQPIDEVINMITEARAVGWDSYWNILKEYPEFEKTCLEACIEVARTKIDSDEELWKGKKLCNLSNIVDSIYDFNKRHVKAKSNIERMSVTNYPWLLGEIKKLVTAKDVEDQFDTRRMKRALKEHEKELYEAWFGKKVEIADVRTGKALALLKRNPQAILDNWKLYVDSCAYHMYKKEVASFLKVIRWHKEIPMKFAQECLVEITEKKNESFLRVLAYLVHGDTFTKVIDPLIPTQISINVEGDEARPKYVLMEAAAISMKIANPPVPLELPARLCQGEYLSNVFVSLTSICRRVSFVKVQQFAQTLVNSRVSVRKHGIRLVYMVETMPENAKFLRLQWNSEKHHSIRDVLFSKVQDLFRRNPTPIAWSLLKDYITNMTKDDQRMLSRITNLGTIPTEHIAEYIELVLGTLDRHVEIGWDLQEVTKCRVNLIKQIDQSICKFLSEEFCQRLIKRFLFNLDDKLADAGKNFVISYIFSAGDKLDSRLAMVTDVFVDAAKTSWNVSQPEASHYCPVNHTFDVFACEIVSRLLNRTEDEEICYRVIDSVLKIFQTVLKPEMAPNAYWNLVFAKERRGAKSSKEYGLIIGQKLDSLVEIFSPMLLSAMTDVLVYLMWMYFYTFNGASSQEVYMDIAEGLMESGAMNAYVMGAHIMSSIKEKSILPRYERMVKKFLDCKHPAITAIISKCLADATFAERE